MHYTSAYTESQRLINLLKISKHVSGRIEERQAALSSALPGLDAPTVPAKGFARLCKTLLITKSWTSLGMDYLCRKGGGSNFIAKMKQKAGLMETKAPTCLNHTA